MRLIENIKKIWFFYNQKINQYQVDGVLNFNTFGSLQKFGVNTLKKCCQTLEKHKIPYSLGWGTALGIFRENRLIPHDNDLDIDLLDYPDYELVIRLLELIGLRLQIKVFYRKKIQQLVFLSQDNIPLDIVFWVRKGNKAVTYCEPGYILKLPIHLLNKKKYFEFSGYNFLVPLFIENYLVSIYGKNWRIPNEIKGDWKKDCHIIHKRFDPFFWLFHYLYPLYCKYIKKNYVK